MIVQPARKWSGDIRVPGDKSISHRALLLGSMAAGKSEIMGAQTTGDCFSTMECLGMLGIEISRKEQDVLKIEGKGTRGYRRPAGPLDAGNSGTTMRLLAGILAGQSFPSILTGDASLRQRPMGRVVVPLRMMGADISGQAGDTRAPLCIQGKSLQALDRYLLPVASAQVKSSLLLAGFFTEGIHSIIERQSTRDHTEIMLAELGVKIDKSGTCLAMPGGQELKPGRIRVPGDFSSAAFLIAAALLIPGSHLRIVKVGLNPTRTGFLDVIKEMGAEVEISNEEVWNGEQVGNVTVSASTLQGIELRQDIIPRIIDELPLIAVLGAYAEGTTVVSGARELRLKESDRIHAIVTELKKMGGDLIESEDGFIVQGKRKLNGSSLFSYGDHRIAMALAVAALRGTGVSTIHDAECIRVSYPDFFGAIDQLSSSW